jgi:hypothetical protein
MSSSVLNLNNVLTNYSAKVANFTKFVWFFCLIVEFQNSENKKIVAQNC